MKALHLALAGTFGLMACASVGSASTLFLAHYDGNTGNGGLNADYAAGSAAAVTTGGTISSTAKFGAGSLDTDGASALTTYSTAGNFNVNAGTIDMWVNTAAWGGSYRGLFDVYDSGPQDIRIQELPSGALQVYQSDGTNVWSLTSAALTPSNNDWHLVSWAWNSTNNTSTLYLDGGIVANTVSGTVGSYTGALPTTFGVGEIQNQTGSQWNGLIDDFRISSTDLYGGQAFTPPTTPFPTPGVPEPASVALLAIGGLVLSRRRHA